MFSLRWGVKNAIPVDRKAIFRPFLVYISTKRASGNTAHALPFRGRLSRLACTRAYAAHARDIAVAFSGRLDLISSYLRVI